METELFLSKREIENLVLKNIEIYEKLNILESFAMYMGKAQVLEFSLKNLLSRKYDIDMNNMEKWTLGKVKEQLKKQGIRQDFIHQLSNVVNKRNYIAHEFLVNTGITKSITNFSDRKIFGDLFRATYELEQILIIYDLTEKYNAWE